jgi:hypothetical protein
MRSPLLHHLAARLAALPQAWTDASQGALPQARQQQQQQMVCRLRLRQL